MTKRFVCLILVIAFGIGYSSAYDANSFLQWIAGLPAPQTVDSGKFLKADGTWDLPFAGSVAWGGITGTLSAQTDLQSALDSKISGIAWGSITGTLSSQSDLNTSLSGKAATNKAQSVVLMASGTWTNMPAANTVFLGVWTNVSKIDLSLYTQGRLTVNKLGTAGAASSVVRLRYATSYSQTIGNYSTMGSSEIQVAVNVTNTMQDTGWINLVSGAKVDNIFIVIDGVNGDGVLDPVFGNIVAQFR